MLVDQLIDRSLELLVLSLSDFFVMNASDPWLCKVRSESIDLSSRLSQDEIKSQVRNEVHICLIVFSNVQRWYGIIPSSFSLHTYYSNMQHSLIIAGYQTTASKPHPT